MEFGVLPSARELAQFSLACQRAVDWVPDADRLENLTAEHSFDHQLATDLELAQQRADHFALEIPSQSYLNRWVHVAADLHGMLSIRFKGLDVNQPFIDVSVTTRPVNREDLVPLKMAAQRVYADFRPLRLRFWSPTVMDVFPETTPDARALAAPLADLRAQLTPPELQLRPTRDDQHFDQAQDAYDAVDAQHPEHVEHAQLLSREDLAQCIQAGTMFDVLWNGVWSGYAGTLPKTKLGFPAQSVQELLLTPKARGQGLGRALGPLLAQALPDDGRVLFGTIHGRNVGARRAALSAGRFDLGGWNWLSLA